MEELSIAPDESRSFHNALHDAYYTALVFAKLPHPERVLQYRQKPKQLTTPTVPGREKLPGETFDSLHDALGQRYGAASPLPPLR